STAKAAIEETIDTAKLAERLGYHRIWVSEHHNSTMIAGSAPAVLMVKLADATENLRIGSGGVMLPNHSAYKVAENFRLLETLFPGRIDLGMGRAPGGDRISASLLNPSNTFSEESYLQQLRHLQAFFTDEAGTSYGPLVAAPQIPSVPQQWILSSSGGSAAIAAQFGLGLVVARFINGFAGPDVVEAYRNAFQPSETFPAPKAMLAITVLCADTEEKARQMRKT
ncbi:MAG: MsnO8 family LLM class oxidoreductase, partial [Hymenobacter sp.]